MVTISGKDITTSIARALQHISCYHPTDFIMAMTKAYEKEEAPAAKDAIAQILTNSRLAAQAKRPICQDTGVVVVFMDIGRAVTIGGNESIDDLINQGVRLAYTHPENILRASMLEDPAGARKNTQDNAPAIVHIRLVEGNTLSFRIAAKGGGSENKTKFAMLNPAASVVDWAVAAFKEMGAGWCPPGIMGIGIGGTPEKAMLMAKESLMAPIDIDELIQKGAQTTAENIRLQLFEKFNQTGIGAQGLGGCTTVLDVKVNEFPTHAASLAVAMIPNCAASRHIHFTLDGTGPAHFEAPSLDKWPDICWKAASDARYVDLDCLTPEEVQRWQPGQTLLLSGKLLTARDAAHKKMVDLLENNQPLPNDLNLKNRVIYYVGPINPIKDEIVGPAGPTTATRMDPFTQTMLEKTGLLAMIGKAERSQTTIDLIAKHKAAYLIAVGGAAYLVSKSITASRIVAFEELGMEAIYEFTVKDMPVTVAVNSQGYSIHQKGPAYWEQKINFPAALTKNLNPKI